MLKVIWLLGVLLLAGLVTATDAAEVESNCSMGHAATPEEGYFSAVHTAQGGAGLDSSSCRGDSADESLQQQLNSIFGK